MSPTPVFLSILLATTAYADLRFDPVAPTTRTPVTVHFIYGAGCPQTVSHEGTTTVITLDRCASSVLPVNYSVDIGLLQPGVNHVRVELAGTPAQLFTEGTLTVRDAAPAFQITPSVGYTSGDLVEIIGPGSNDVRFDGIPATVVGPSRRGFQVVAPRHDPGVVDVTVGNARVAAAFDYVSQNQPDPAFFEPVLFPVIYNGPGAVGSMWQTDVSVRNENDYPLTTLVNPLQVLCFPHCDLRPPAHSTFNLFGGVQISNGLVSYVPRQAAPNLHFDILVKDLSQQEKALGTEIAVVREKDFFDHPFELLNIPTDSRFRAALRAYDLGTAPRIVLQIFTMNGTEPIVSTELFYGGHDPAFVMIPDLVAAYPELDGKGPLRIVLDPATLGPATAWGFVSVTNNETQHVTTISPQ